MPMLKRLFASRFWPLLLVLLSLICTFLHPFYGTIVALFLAVIFQVLLPGYLLTRQFGRQQVAHPIARFAWILFGGLGLTVAIGAFMRLTGVPVPTYLLILHAMMAGLALLPAQSAPESDHHWRWSARKLPLYLLVGLCCLVVLGVNYESRSRFYGFEDQPIFISQIDWMATRPYDTPPGGFPFRSRQIGVAISGSGDTRFDTDGLTYTQAAWCWSSGVKAYQFYWYDISTVFIWTVPLLAFALAYELTGREDAGAWTAAGLTVAALFTLDNIAYNPNFESYGRLAVFQINTLRQFSLTIMLPLTLMAGLSYLRAPRGRDLLLIGICGFAMATMHPFQATIFAAVMGGVGLLRWIAGKIQTTEIPSTPRENQKLLTLARLIPLLVVVGCLLLLPFLQRLNFATKGAQISTFGDDEAAPTSTAPDAFIQLGQIPGLGNIFTRDPARFFYHPIIILAVIIGLIGGWRWRRSLAAQYLLAATLLSLIASFTPGLTTFINRFASTVGLLNMFFLLPIPVALGLGAEWLAGQLEKRSGSFKPAVSWLTVGAAAAWMGITLFEPFPLSGTARDQINSFNTLQSFRQLHPSQTALTAELRNLLPADGYTVVMAPYNPTNVIIEEVPGAFITGGRLSRNFGGVLDARFYTTTTPKAPWLDTADLDYITQIGASMMVLEADDTRLPQIMLQPERFEPLSLVDGYSIFKIQAGFYPDEIDALYKQMNLLYGEIATPRWDSKGFNLALPGDERWQHFAAAWSEILADYPNDDRARLGLAFSLTMWGDDAQAASVWGVLRGRHPDVLLYPVAEAFSRYSSNPNHRSIEPLLTALAAPEVGVRMLSAQALLTDTLFYLMTPEELAQTLMVIDADTETWAELAELDQPDAIRRRATLLMNAGQYTTAAAWLNRIRPSELYPADVTALASLALAQGDISSALALVGQTTDADWVMPRNQAHPDAWVNNTAAQFYDILRGGLATNLADAESAYQSAVNRGGVIAGNYFLAQALRNAGETERADALMGVVNAAWNEAYDIPLPELVHPLAIAEAHNLYVLNPVVSRTDEQTVTVTATFGTFQPARSGLPFTLWSSQIVWPDGDAQVGAPAQMVDGALVRATVNIPLPEGVQPLTAAQLYIQARYDNRVTTTPLVLPLVLQRPAPVIIPTDVTPLNWHFGDHIGLMGSALQAAPEQIALTLYWGTDAQLAEDYQVFVHVYNAAGERVAQQDSTPLDNRYPTSQWRTDGAIADTHILNLETPLPPGQYTIRIGLYRLSDNLRLSITPADPAVQDDSLTLLHFDL